MFLVGDTLESRQKRIRALLTKDTATIGVLASAADFEWTVRRAVLALGRGRSVDIRARLARCHGLDAYKDAWADEVGWRGRRLPEVVGPDWRFFRGQAFELRNKLVHGVQGTSGLRFASKRVESILSASRAVVHFAASHDADLFTRLPIRRRTHAGGATSRAS